MAKKPKKTAIVGTASSWKDAPFGDPDWEIWTLRGGRTVLPRWDQFYEIHAPSGVQANDYDYWLWLRGLPAGHKPVFMARKLPEVPASVAYPRKQIETKFPAIVLQCSMSWMIARALYIGRKRIGVWGVHSEQADEVAYQKQGLLVLKWIAEHVYGAELTFADASPLNLPVPVYGFDEASPESKVMVERFRKQSARKTELEGRAKVLLEEARRIDGTLEESKFVISNLTVPPPGSFFDDFIEET